MQKTIPLCVLLCVMISLVASDLSYKIRPSLHRGNWDHYWERLVGSGHATLALRKDYQDQLRKTHKELGFQSVRFHGIFDDDMSVVIQDGNNLIYSWHNIDIIFDFLVEIGMSPYVELSFMPEALSSGTNTVMHYKGNIDPPKDWNQWYDFIQAFATHVVDRYGIDVVSQWNFEVWNEPNLGTTFWTGGLEGYLKLYNYTACALKSVNSRLQVGGPSTAQSGWIEEFLTYVIKNKIPIDFFSTHEYPTDPNCDQSNLNCFSELLNQTKTSVEKLMGKKFPVFYSEYNDGLFYSPNYHGTPFASSFIMKNIFEINGSIEKLSWWTFSDIFEENGFLSQPFGANTQWGLLNINSIAKPSYRAFELLRKTGNTLVDVVGKSSETVGIYATVENVHNLKIIGYNFNLPTNEIKSETIHLTIDGSTHRKGKLFRIDDTHANAPALWEAMGSPMYLTQSQIAQLHEASRLHHEEIDLHHSDDGAHVTIELPPHGVFLLEL